MTIKLFNTMTQKKEEFIPLDEKKVKFYVCGPTVYDYIHLGNARAFVVFDVLRRFLEYRGFEVTYVMNLTDIDDRIIDRSIADKINVEVITSRYIQAFLEDMDQLGVKRATIHPRATENIEEIIALIASLVEKDYAYSVDGNVFFEVSRFEKYGDLSGKKMSELRSGARVSVDEKKRSPLDFALWKSQKPGEPAWQSPWGAGRPGWHIECSAMSMKCLGESFDIHAGGVDLVFPHHENEIAQSECATDSKFARYWLHNGFLKIEGDKMSKSLGNFRTVRDALKQHSAAEIRLFFLQKHYRSPIDLTEAGLKAAASAAARLSGFYSKAKSRLDDGEDVATSEASGSDDVQSALAPFEKLKSELLDALDNDLNTPVAVARLFDMVRDANRLLAKDSLSAQEMDALRFVVTTLEELDAIFGIIDKADQGGSDKLVGNLVELLIDIRNDLRGKKEWAMADKVRDELASRGVVLEDKADSTTWRLR